MRVPSRAPLNGSVRRHNMSDEVEALEWDLRRALLPELRRVARTGDDLFFSLDQPRVTNGRPTVLKLAEEIMKARQMLKEAPSHRSAASAFLLSCLKWRHAGLGEAPSSALLAQELLAYLEDDDA